MDGKQIKFEAEAADEKLETAAQNTSIVELSATDAMLKKLAEENAKLKKQLAKRQNRKELAPAPFDPSVPRPHAGSYIDAIDPLLATSDSFDHRKGHLSSDIDSRAMADRENEDRKNHFRKIFGSGVKGKTYIDPTEIMAGKVYGCKARSVKNVPLEANIMEARREGWEYIPPSRHPNRIVDLSADYLGIEGLVMMDREIFIHELQQTVQQEEMDKRRKYMSRYVQEGEGDPSRVSYRDPGQYSFNMNDSNVGGYQPRGQ